MLSSNSLMQWLDTTNMTSALSMISGFLRSYSTCRKIQRIDGREVYDFNDQRVHVRDLDGWTELKCITIIPNTNKDVYDPIDWRRIGIGKEEIEVSADTLIPVYDHENIKYPKVGFHGERIYEYKLKHPDMILPSDYIRITGPLGSDTDKFKNISSIERITGEHIFGCSIITKSRFININRLYMFADEAINVDEAKAMCT